MMRLAIFFSLIILMSCSKGTVDFLISESGHQKAPAQYEFINKSEGYDSYIWDFGDGTTSQDSVATHYYLYSGKYDVSLRAIKGSKVKIAKKHVVISPPEECLVLVETDFGNILIQLFEDTPIHRDNFVKLAEEGYYDGTLFHRVINGFMMQGGDPDSRDAPPQKSLGRGGPGYDLTAEIRTNHAHVKGALAAARIGGPANPERRSSGSQFYIVHGRPVDDNLLRNQEYRFDFTYSRELKESYLSNGGAPFLDMDYTVFGQVIEGFEVIDAIAGQQTNASDRPLKDVVMKVKIIK